MATKNKKQSRLRRARKLRYKIQRVGVPRLCVHRSGKHIYAQVIDASGSRVLASASTLSPALRSGLDNTGNCDAAAKVGAQIADQVKELGFEKVAFDRSGFRYHGRIKALAESAREAGLKI